MKEINNLKGMLVAGYLIEKLQRFRLCMQLGRNICHIIVFLVGYKV